MKPSILILAAAALALASCETLKNVPVTVFYETDVAGHAVKTGYTTDGGAFLSGRRVRPQK